MELEEVEDVSNKQPEDVVIPIRPIPLPEPHQNITDLSVLDEIFNQYATLKTVTVGSLILALMASNFAQLKIIVMPSSGIPNWNAINVILITGIAISLIIQIFIGSGLLFLVTSDNFVDEEKRSGIIKKNNWVALLVVAISILNIFLNIFMSTA